MICAEILTACLEAASRDALALMLLRLDPVAALLAPEPQQRMVRAALEEGDKIGLTLRSRHHGMVPEAIARALGIIVVETREQSWAGPFLRYADYRSRPPEIS